MHQNNNLSFYTVGTSNLLSPRHLWALAQNLDALVVDARAQPWGHVRAGFARAELVTLLGDSYQWRGDRIGGVRGTSLGPTDAGIAELVAEEKAGDRRLLLCAETAPAECHRHTSIALPLFGVFGVVLNHIHLTPQAEEVIEAPELERAILQKTSYAYTDLGDHYPRGPVAVFIIPPTVADTGRRI